MTQLFIVVVVIAPPLMVALLTTGLVNVLLVNVSAVARPTRVSETAGTTIVFETPAGKDSVQTWFVSFADTSNSTRPLLLLFENTCLPVDFTFSSSPAAPCVLMDSMTGGDDPAAFDTLMLLAAEDVAPNPRTCAAFESSMLWSTPILMPLKAVTRPVTSNTPERVVSPVTSKKLDRDALVNVDAPVTSRVLDSVAAPVTPSVVFIVAEPLTSKVPVVVMPTTSNVLFIVAEPSTVSESVQLAAPFAVSAV